MKQNRWKIVRCSQSYWIKIGSLNIYRHEERFKVNYLGFHFQNLEKGEQSKPNISRKT